MHCDFLGSVGLQETHMDTLKPFDAKSVTLTMRGGFFTKFAALAHGAALRNPSLNDVCHYQGVKKMWCLKFVT